MSGVYTKKTLKTAHAHARTIKIHFELLSQHFALVFIDAQRDNSPCKTLFGRFRSICFRPQNIGLSFPKSILLEKRTSPKNQNRYYVYTVVCVPSTLSFFSNRSNSFWSSSMPEIARIFRLRSFVSFRSFSFSIVKASRDDFGSESTLRDEFVSFRFFFRFFFEVSVFWALRNARNTYRDSTNAFGLLCGKVIPHCHF